MFVRAISFQYVDDLVGGMVRMMFTGDDSRQRKPGISLANANLNGWHPVIGLDEGLRHTIDYFDCVLTTFNKKQG